MLLRKVLPLATTSGKHAGRWSRLSTASGRADLQTTSTRCHALGNILQKLSNSPNAGNDRATTTRSINTRVKSCRDHYLCYRLPDLRWTKAQICMFTTDERAVKRSTPVIALSQELSDNKSHVGTLISLSLVILFVLRRGLGGGYRSRSLYRTTGQSCQDSLWKVPWYGMQCFSFDRYSFVL